MLTLPGFLLLALGAIGVGYAVSHHKNKAAPPPPPPDDTELPPPVADVRHLPGWSPKRGHYGYYDGRGNYRRG